MSTQTETNSEYFKVTKITPSELKPRGVGRPKKERTKLVVYLTPNVAEGIRRYAFETHQTYSDVADIAMRQFLDTQKENK